MEPITVKLRMRLLFSLAVIIIGIIMTLPYTWHAYSANDHDARDSDSHHHEKEEMEGHESPEAHNGDDEHMEEMLVKLSDEELREFGIEMRKAGPKDIASQVRLPGEIVINQNRLAHLVPRVSGVAIKILKAQGDKVTGGDGLAVLSSRDLADAKSAYLAMREHSNLTRLGYEREKSLWKKKITSEQDYLESQNAWAEARIELRAAEQKLHALGLSHEDLKQLPNQPDTEFTHYGLLAPFDGTVIEKHIVLGEIVDEEKEAFTIADLSTVWVNITVYEKNLASIKLGQKVLVRKKHNGTEATGNIEYISPVIDESTRTATARVVINNTDGQWRPGRFITALVSLETLKVDLAVPRSALQTIDGHEVVFVYSKEGLVPRPVRTGKTDSNWVEILSGLKSGDRYAATNAFTLKAELGKQAFGDDHGH